MKHRIKLRYVNGNSRSVGLSYDTRIIFYVVEERKNSFYGIYKTGKEKQLITHKKSWSGAIRLAKTLTRIYMEGYEEGYKHGWEVYA